jgi:hypothetical protein
MRHMIVLGSVLLPAALLATGCASNVPRADGPAGPLTPPAASSAPSTAVQPTASASPPPSVRPIPSNTATSHRPSVVKALGPTGFGALKLGMSSRNATATGLIVAWTGTEGPSCGFRSHLIGGHGVEAGSDGTVLESRRLGVEVIDAYPGISTPEGIHLGSSQAELYRAYPSWKNASEPQPFADGRGLVPVPGNSAAYYRIVKYKGKVVQLTLQLKNQDCYE